MVKYIGANDAKARFSLISKLITVDTKAAFNSPTFPTIETLVATLK